MPPRITRQQEELFITYVEQQLKIKNWSDWYNVNSKDLSKFSLGIELVRKYGPWKLEKKEQTNAVANMLKSLKPQHPWDEKKFKSPLFGREGYWNSSTHQRQFLENLAKELDIKDFSGWYNIAVAHIAEHGGKSLLRDRTIHSLLKSAFPEYNFKFWKFRSFDDKLWNEIRYQREFLDDCEKEFQIVDKSGWYQIKQKDISLQGGNKLLQIYQYSMFNMLKSVYTEYEFLPWLFSPVQADFWKIKENQMEFMKHAAKKYDIKSMEDWYKIHLSDLRNIGGFGILHLYDDSLFKLVSSVFPNYEWKEENFVPEFDSFWRSEEAQRNFLEKAEKHFNIKTWEDWYKVPQKDFSALGGSTLLLFYDNSLTKFLISIYSDKPWDMFKFERLPRNFWEEKENIKKALDYIAKNLQIKEYDDWYSVTTSQISKMGFSHLLVKYGSINSLLQEFFPQHKWDKNTTNKVSKRHWRLFKVLQSLYPDASDIYVNYPHPQLSFPESGLLMELDIFIPSLNLAFEYQGQQHYEELRVFGAIEFRQEKDKEKRKACKEIGLTLVEVPHWWNGTKEELVDLISKEAANT